MRVLIVSPVPTHPPTSGNTSRILALSEALQRQGHEVWFLHSASHGGDTAAMTEFWGERYISHPYTRPWHKHRFFLGGIPIPDRWHGHFVIRGWAYQTVDHVYDLTLSEAARALHAKHAFEVVIAEYVFCSKVLEVFPSSVRKLLDTHDVYSDRHDLFKANSQTPEWFFTIRKEELKGLLRADCVLAIQEPEKRFFEGLLDGQREVVTVGHFVEPRPLPSSGAVRNILYLGSGNTLNLRAIREFLARVWPVLQKRAPQMRLLIAGGVCRELTEEPGVTLLGVLDSVEDAYRQADVVINPMTFGTGLKIKSLEALAFGMPLVTTPCGAEGLEGGAGKAFVVAASEETFCEALVTLHNAPGRTRMLAEAAAQYAGAYLSEQRQSLEHAVSGPVRKETATA